MTRCFVRYKQRPPAAAVLLACLGAIATAPSFGASFEQRCLAMADKAPPSSTSSTFRVRQAIYHAEGEPQEIRLEQGGTRMAKLPAHCELIAETPARQADGQRYAIRFRLRLPSDWNNRFLFQGGGGSNGDIGDATGKLYGADDTAIERHYAVLSQDSGHDNASNNDPLRGGQMVFASDPTARSDYGHASLKRSADAGLWLVRQYYGQKPRYNYFVGCSKGGQEGMAFAQRYPEIFDGIIASAPGFALPKAALAEAWDTRAFSRVIQTPGAAGFDVSRLHTAFNGVQLKLVREAILDACDADDGLRDDMVADVDRCTDRKVLAQLRGKICPASGATADCLSPTQIDALVESMRGPLGSAGQALYNRWFWPSGIDSPAWRVWKIGSEDGQVPPLNVVLGGQALASVFSTPPVMLPPGPQALADYQTGLDFDSAAAKVQAVAAPFRHSAWEDISARSTDLTRFKARHGRLMVPHGESDPVFSLADTLDWFDQLNRREHGRAGEFARVFPVPGMCHCSGGPATTEFDSLAAMVDWVEHGRAPDRLEASAGPDTPWPGRTRPLCPYPQVARYRGNGDPEKAENFACTP